VIDGKPHPPSTLYRTTDGGAHWQRIATGVPVSGGLRFTSATTGWGLTLTKLERTDDGGSTWRTVPIAATPTVHNNLRGELWSAPYVFGDRVVLHGILPISAPRRRLFVEVSNDGGAHWSVQLVASKVAAPPFANPWEFAAIDADHWRYVDGTSIASTDDAGKTWQVQPNTVPLTAKTTVSFVTPDTAFAMECGLGNAACRSAVTTDGGKTWRFTQPSLS
jgi:photosystem II stability/assembly factor-like uncharacterized protein